MAQRQQKEADPDATVILLAPKFKVMSVDMERRITRNRA